MKKNLSRNQITIILSIVIIILLILVIVLAINKKETNEETEMNISLKDLGNFIVITDTEEEEEETEEETTTETEEQEIITTDYDKYSIVLSNDKYYLVYNDETVVANVEVSSDGIGKTYKNSETNKYVYAVCYVDHKDEIDCEIYSDSSSNYNYVDTFNSGDTKIIIYGTIDGSMKIYDYGEYPGYGCFSSTSSDENEYLAIKSNGKNIIIDLSTGKELFNNELNYDFYGNSNRLSSGEGFAVSSDKYMVVIDESLEKQGLINYHTGEIVIDLKYDNLLTVGDDVLIAEKNSKYGIIDSKENIIIDYSYDTIRNVTTDDGLYYVVSIGDKLGIIDSTGKTVVDIKYQYNENVYGGFMLRGCCGEGYPYSDYYSTNDTIEVSYYSPSDSNYTSYTKYIKYNTSTGKLTTGTY